MADMEEYGCSTLLLHTPNTRLLLHNEDCDPLVKDCGFLLTADVAEDGDGQEEKEQFTSFTYPGTLPGRAFSFNRHGLVITSNVLLPAQGVTGAPSRLFLCRSVLKARDVEDARRLALNKPYGFSLNLATRHGHMASLEVAPGMPQTRMHVQHVAGFVDSDGGVGEEDGHSSAKEGRHYYHFNSYKHLKVQEGGVMRSSRARAKRAGELAPPRTLQQALQFAADTHDPLLPIYRTPRPSDLGQTVCTALFDLGAGQARFYGCREGLLSDSPAVVLPMYE